MSSRARKLLPILLVLALGLSAPHVRGDDREDAEQFLRKNLQGKIVALKHFYSGGRLQFDRDGNLKKVGDVCPWTLCAQIKISQVNLRSDKLEMKGRRLLLQYKEDLKNPRGLEGPPVSIEIEVARNTVKVDTLFQSLNKVFLSRQEPLADAVPAYWRQFLLYISSGKKAEEAHLSLNGQPIQKFEAGKVSAPRQIFAPSPEYSREARSAGYQGTLILSLVVNTQGEAESISITKPLGVGLDDQAVEKVQTWKFQPGMRDGSPVPVRVLLEVTFSLSATPAVVSPPNDASFPNR